jgi:hypothetical protein
MAIRAAKIALFVKQPCDRANAMHSLVIYYESSRLTPRLFYPPLSAGRGSRPTFAPDDQISSTTAMVEVNLLPFTSP